MSTLTPEREHELRKMELVNEWTSADEDALWATLDATRAENERLKARVASLEDVAQRWADKKEINSDDCDVYEDGTCAGRGFDVFASCLTCATRAALNSTGGQK